MTLLEDRLRSGLQELADDSTTTVKANQVLALLGRRDRQRHVRQLVAAGAAVVTAGLLGWAVLGPHPLTVHPAPLASPTVQSGSTVGVFGFESDLPGRSRIVTVQAEITGPTMTVQATDEPYAGPGTVRRTTYSATPGQFFTTDLTGGFAIAVIPDVVRSLSLSPVLGPQPRHWTDTRLGITLVSWSTAQWKAALKVTPTLVWLGSDGLVHTTPERVLTSATLSIDDTSLTVYRGPGDGNWGVFTNVDAWLPPMAWGNPKDAEIRVLARNVGRASAGMLPDGATAVTITPTEDARWTVAAMPDGSQWYFVLSNREVSSDSSTQRLVKSIAYTDRTGRRVTYTPRLSS